MKLTLSSIAKYFLIFFVLTAFFFYISARFDSQKSKFSKVDLTFVKNDSDDFKKIIQLTQELEFLCRNSGHNYCGAFNIPDLRGFVPLLGGNSNQNLNDTIITDFFSDYANSEVLISFVISNDSLSKTTAIQNTIQDIPKNITFELFERYHHFLKNEKVLLDKYHDLFSSLDLKKKAYLLSKSASKLQELEDKYRKTPYMLLKEKNEALLFRKMSNTLRLVLSAMFTLIVIFYTRQLYNNVIKNKILANKN